MCYIMKCELLKSDAVDAINAKCHSKCIVTLPHPRSGDSQGQETCLAPFVDNQTRNYDIECANHHPSLSVLKSYIY